MMKSYVIGVTYVAPTVEKESHTLVRLFLADPFRWYDEFSSLARRPNSTERYLLVEIVNGKIVRASYIGFPGQMYDGGILDKFLDPQIITALYDNRHTGLESLITAQNLIDDRFWAYLQVSPMVENASTDQNGYYLRDKEHVEWKHGVDETQEATVIAGKVPTVTIEPLDIGIEALIGDAWSIINGRLVERIISGEYDDDPSLDEFDDQRVVAGAIAHSRTGGPSMMTEAMFLLLEDGKMYYLDNTHPRRGCIWKQLISKDVQSIKSGKSWRETDYQGIGRLIR